MFQALHRSVQLNIVFPLGLKPPGSCGCKGRTVTEWEHPHSPGESLLPALATGGIRERLTLGEGQGDLRCLPSQGAGLGDQALFIWAVDIAWRKEQRNVRLGSASSSRGSAQLQLRDCFYLFITIISVRMSNMRLQLIAPRGLQILEHPMETKYLW